MYSVEGLSHLKYKHLMKEMLAPPVPVVLLPDVPSNSIINQVHQLDSNVKLRRVGVQVVIEIKSC